MGDVAYGGGSQLVNNATRDAFQTYLHGQVPVEALLVQKWWRVDFCVVVLVCFHGDVKFLRYDFWKLFGLMGTTKDRVYPVMGNHVAASGHPFSLQLVVAVGGGWDGDGDPILTY